MSGHVLVIEDDRAMGALYRSALSSCGHQVSIADRGDTGYQMAKEGNYDAIISDFMMPGLDGLDLLEKLRASNPFVPVILMTGHGSAETAIEAMKRGAYDYLLKPVQLDELMETVEKAIVNSRIQTQSVRVGTPAEAGKEGEGLHMVGSCPAMQKIFKEIGRIAAKPVTVLIRGETGTGKELVAQAVYHYSNRKGKPFVVVNCAAIPETLLESELFGSEKGAFTGAQARRIGRFEQAHTGTLFLDEIGELSPGTQAKLLRALQERVIQRLGSNEAISVDVRVIAATNRNLEEAIQEKQFREDLYYRLNDATISLPPLRERQGDVPELIGYFISHHAKDLGAQRPGITPETVDYLASLPWPGNVRQLQSFLRQAILASRGYAISLETVKEMLSREGKTGGGKGAADRPFRDFIAEVLEGASTAKEPDAYAVAIRAAERELLSQAIRLTKGNQSLAARWLGISRLTLRTKLTELGLREASEKEE
ncbi:two-component system, NtrC family, nitrogen regulation response regulator GlnG [Verrucomicrobium sp. GAS474]|uniref:sigma-54-dependent transcriptional regulator n=1 Tax=Verrucomicrobium sp. GAS474 TaxID=1882831 RepID=UPI000879E74F|nr:sigma-54 dependent transcriptional regulator [Verrucomicrobium sp. GAS474]SDU14147.1 two-component system, NtrC family, nitrogen regulation response regulator GlnG [Verrucomicrobium sp. GAS474]